MVLDAGHWQWMSGEGSVGGRVEVARVVTRSSAGSGGCGGVVLRGLVLGGVGSFGSVGV